MQQMANIAACRKKKYHWLVYEYGEFPFISYAIVLEHNVEHGE